MVPPTAKTAAYRSRASRFQLGAVGRRGGAQKRSQVQLSGGGVRIQRGRDFVALKHLLSTPQKLQQRCRRNRDIFDNGRRSRLALEARQQRHHFARQRPHELHVLERVCLIGDHGVDVQGADRPDDHLDAITALGIAEADLLDDQRHFGRRRNQLFEPRIGLACQRKQPPIHEIAGARLQLGDFLNGLDRRLEVAKQQQGDCPMRRQGRRVQRRRREQAQRPLGADQEPRDVQFRSRENSPQVIAGRIADERRLFAANEVAVLDQQRRDPLDDRSLGRLGVAVADGLCVESGFRNEGRLELGRRQRFLAEFNDGAAGQYRFDALDMIARRADTNRMRAGRVDGEHPPDGCDGRIRRIGRKIPPVRPQDVVEPIPHHPRLHADGLLADRLDVAHVAGEVDDQPFADRSARHAGPGSAGDQRSSRLGGILREHDDVVTIDRAGHAQRRNLKNAGVAGVGRQHQGLAVHVPAEDSGEVFGELTLAFVHVVTAVRRVRSAAADRRAAIEKSRIRTKRLNRSFACSSEMV